MPDLLVIVPTRGRPRSVAAVAEAWDFTGGWDAADLMFVADIDDPALEEYRAEVGRTRARLAAPDPWRPLVPKLNAAAVAEAGRYFALAFAGDDHLPRTFGWATGMLAALRELGTGVVYGDDLLRGESLASSWAMTSDIVAALGRMVPAPVEHMFCDNAVMELARRAGCLRYLPDVVVEHMHPLAGKAEWDPGYHRVNQAAQYERDGVTWARYVGDGLDADAHTVRQLRATRV